MNNPKVRIAQPKCRHAPKGTVSWPNIDELRVGIPHASTYCCDREECIIDAAWWVEAQTGHPGVFEPFATSVADVATERKAEGDA